MRVCDVCVCVEFFDWPSARSQGGLNFGTAFVGSLNFVPSVRRLMHRLTSIISFTEAQLLLRLR